jgi:hypothetical protein
MKERPNLTASFELQVVALVMSGAAVVLGRPQYSYPVPGPSRPTNPYETNTQIDSAGIGGGSLAVQCQRREVSPGQFQFSCDGVDPRKITLSSEHILWLKGPGGESQQLDIVVPNYRVEELIRAALKAGSGGSTNVNILLKKPQTIYDVQAQEGANIPGAKPVVNLQYEPVREPVSVHYPTEQAYNPLSGPIREP